MLGDSSAILTALTVLSSLKMIPADDLKIFKYDLVRRQSVAIKGAAQTQLINFLSVGAPIYAINITVGTPHQPILIALDTGSADIEVLATNLCTNNQANAQARPNLPIYGIMGVGYPGLDAGVVNNHSNLYSTPVQQMKSQGLINQMAYSLYLNDKNAVAGSILFGGIDNASNFAFVPILPQTPLHFLVSGRPLPSLPTALMGISRLNQPISAILDSGAAFISRTADIVNSIIAGLGISTVDNYSLPCYYGDQQADFTFGFNDDPNATIDIPLSSLLNPVIVSGVQQTDENGDGICKLAVDAGASGSVLLGDSFLRSAYVVFDLENNVISLAQASLNSTTSNIVVIDASPGIGATPIATTVAVTSLPSQTSVIPNTAAAAKPTAATVSLASVSPTFKMTATPTGKSGGATGSAATASASKTSGAVAVKMPGMGNAVWMTGLLGLLSFIAGAGVFVV
ncbi:hypothetical protein MMC17_006561 [Xylographa soralifera]|nr:hypothetical protein [Xylographa soralifera]